MAAGSISIDPEMVKNVAGQCASIQGELENTSKNLSSQLATLQSALTGQAAQHFEDQFQQWQKHVVQLSQTLEQTHSSLMQIAEEAEQQIATLNKLAGL